MHPPEQDIDFSQVRLTHSTSTFVMAEVPEGLVAYVASRCHKEWVRQRVIERLAERVLRRLVGEHDTAAARQSRWASAWSVAGQPRTRRRIARIRSDILREIHVFYVSQHLVPTKLPSYLQELVFDANGALVIDDTDVTNPSFGSTAFLEQTPPQVLRWVHQSWLDGQLLDALSRVAPQLMKAEVWDLTAGSGTGRDYFGVMLGCEVAATDLTIADHHAVLGDCREVGTIPEHGVTNRFRMGEPGVEIPAPDIVLFDPPCMGTPSHAAHYGEVVNPRDLSFLGRNHWLFVIADVVVRAADRLADGGILSLLLRLGERDGASVIPDQSLLADFKEVLGDRAQVVHEMPLIYRRVRAQASLGTARVPAVHLTIARRR